MNLSDVLTNQARFRPDQTAVVFGGERLSFSAFNGQVNRLANALADRGVTRGDKIACVTHNSLEMLNLYWATAKLGVIAVPLSPLLNVLSLENLIGHSEASFVLLSEEAATRLRENRSSELLVPPTNLIVQGAPPEGYVSYEEFVKNSSAAEPSKAAVDESSPCMIIYSSGTTGDPKGIVLSHQARSMYCLIYASAWRMTPESITLHAGSLAFNGAFTTLLPSFYLGGTYILHAAFDPEKVVSTIEEERVTHMVMVPSQIIAMLECPTFRPERLDSLQALISIGAPLNNSHKRRIIEMLGPRFYEMYGLAEGFMTILDKTRSIEKLESVGCPPPFFEMRIVDIDCTEVPTGVTGEIVGKGPIMMDGYYRRPDLTESALVDGWLKSGDIGRIDSDGYLYVSDRKKDLIKSGGVSVYPRDIEEVLVQHPQVLEAAVFGIAHDKWGETPVAAVTLNAGEGRSASKEEIISWTNANVGAKFQRVSDLFILESLPRNAAGKILKRSIKETYLDARKSRS